MAPPASRYLDIDGLRVHFLEAGAGDPVLLLHGWPTSAFLWRNVIGPLSARNRVIALDLPGFGRSDKPPDARYGFKLFTRTIDGLLDALSIDTTGLAVHDLGGPVGLYWACRNPGRLSRLALLNTIVYPMPSWAVVLFVAACRLPGARALLTSRFGLHAAMRLGVYDGSCLTDEVVRAVQEPFDDEDARRALARAGCGLEPRGMFEIARTLPSLRVPVRVVYGERDRILPDVAQTMRRVARDLPQTVVTALPDCGHFLQEERPAEVARILADFFAPARA